MIEFRELLCKHLHNPLGIGLDAPFFRWKIFSDKNNVQQTAFNIQVAKRDDFSTTVWESGWVESDTSVHIIYEGEPLESMTRYFWRVRIKDQSGQNSDWSETAFFETGIHIDDWRAQWIEPENEVDPKAIKPAPFLRNEFFVDKEIKDAKLYITAHGLYEAYLNGKRIGEQVFMPGNTDVANRLQYQVYDVGHLLVGEKNCIGVILGDGWYRGSINVGSLRNAHGEKVGLLAQMKITYTNGDADYFITDENWKTITGPIIMSDMKKGEVYDARHDLSGWNVIGYDDRHWNAVQVAHHELDNLIPSEGAPVRKMEVIQPLEIIHTPKGETVIDFGQNIAGIVKMMVQGDRGTTVRLRHTEVLDKDGNFTDSYFGPSVGGLFRQLDEFTLSGDGVETYEPHFTVHGFRYVKVEGYPGKITPENFEAIAIYSDMGETGFLNVPIQSLTNSSIISCGR
jgi:alpha-L-rhamnosidase